LTQGPGQGVQGVQGVLLLEGGAAFFDRLFARVAGATRAIELRCFDWRDDETGELMAQALIAAADRGVRVTVLKDLVGATYEYYEGSRQSFLHKTIDWRTRREAMLLRLVYGRLAWPRSRPNPLADAFLAHPNITVEGDRRRFDHSKVYVIDDEILFVGGVGVGDDERLLNLDFMIELDGAAYVERYRARDTGKAAFDPDRGIDFLLHAVAVHGRHDCPLLAARLELLAAAESRITIEMAYLGDPRVTDVLVDAVKRGVAVTLVTGTRSNVIPDLNLATCDALLRRTGAPPHLRVVLHDKPVHSKVIVIDGAIVDLGSTNFTRPSHGGYDEVDVYVRDAALAQAIEGAVERHVGGGRLMAGRVPFNRLRAALESAIAARQGRPKTT
jgi:cardiolipin synthase A/B